MGLEFHRIGNKQKARFGGWMPAIGLILAICMGVIAYVTGPSVAQWIDRQSANFPPAGVSQQTIDYAISAMVFVVLLMASWSLVAAFAPRRKTRISEKDMVNSRKDIVQDKKRRKRRQNEMRKKASSELRKKNKAKK